MAGVEEEGRLKGRRRQPAVTAAVAVFALVTGVATAGIMDARSLQQLIATARRDRQVPSR
jgi:hypothetical protein